MPFFWYLCTPVEFRLSELGFNNYEYVTKQ